MKIIVKKFIIGYFDPQILEIVILMVLYLTLHYELFSKNLLLFFMNLINLFINSFHRYIQVCYHAYVYDKTRRF